MSRNNLILVVGVRRAGRYRWFIFCDVNADEEWSEEWARDAVGRCLAGGFTKARALYIAHELQEKQWNTEYGVRVMKLGR